MLITGKKFRCTNTLLHRSHRLFPSSKKIFRRTALFFLSAACVLQLHSADAESRSKSSKSFQKETVTISVSNAMPALYTNVFENTSAAGMKSTYGFMLLRTFIVLAVFGGAAYLIYILSKNRRNKTTGGGGIVQVLSQHPFDIRSGIRIVRIGKSIFAVGYSADSITLITEITDKETVDTIKVNEAAQKPASGFFQDILAGYIPFKRREAVEVTQNIRKKIEGL